MTYALAIIGAAVAGAAIMQGIFFAANPSLAMGPFARLVIVTASGAVSGIIIFSLVQRYDSPHPRMYWQAAKGVVLTQPESEKP